MILRLLLAVSIYVACMHSAGCDDGSDPVTEPIERFAWVLVVDAATMAPVADLDLVLYDLDAGRIVAPPIATGTLGDAEVAEPGEGRLSWFVLPGQGWIPAGLPEPATVFTRNDVNPPIVPVLRLLEARLGGGLVVSGTVVDGLSGQPLSGVIVGHPGWPTAWDGLDETTSDVTGDDGVFDARNVLFALEPGGDVPYQVLPLVFQAEGYQPRALRFEEPGEGHVVRLTPLTGGGVGTGAIAGRVVWRTDPLPGLGVVGTWGESGQKSWLPHPGVVTTSDEDGRFVLDGLPAGEWLGKPGYLPTDGWILIPGPGGHGGSLPAMVTAGDTIEVGDLLCLPAIPPRSPLPGVVGVDSLPIFRWNAVAGADSYDVFVGRWWLGRTAADSLAVPSDSPLGEGSWSWYMNARTAAGELVGLSETRFRFVVGPFSE